MYLSSQDKEGIWHVMGGVGLIGAVFLGFYIGDLIDLKKGNSPPNSSHYNPVANVEYNKIQNVKNSETGLVEKINGEMK